MKLSLKINYKDKEYKNNDNNKHNVKPSNTSPFKTKNYVKYVKSNYNNTIY